MKNYQQALDITLVYSGNNYFDVLEKIINESRDTLHLQTYIFESDETGLRIAEALKRAAKRNVKVYMLVDAYGCYPFSKDTAKDLKDSGVNFRLFSPLFSSESIYFGRRLHHKIIVADASVALTGGINIADKYSGKKEGKAWLDYAVLTKGEVCEYLHILCETFYHKKGSGAIKNYEKKIIAHKISDRSNLIRFRRNDWIKNKNEIHKSYAESVISAQKSIVIVASYFLPGSTFRKLLKQAAARGVQTTIILAGQSDIPSLRLAEHFMYDFYLKNNIRIFEWTNSVMHGKAMIIDNQWATIGSYNINLLSHYISVELNAEIIDPAFVQNFDAHLEKIRTSNCCEIKPEEIGAAKYSWFQIIKMRIAYQFYTLLMSVMMAGRKYKKRNNQ